MYERPTGQPEPPRTGLRKHWPPGFNPFVLPGSASAFQPNWFSVKERVTNAVLALALFAYGSFGVWIDDLYVPGKRTAGVHLHGIPAWLMYGALISAASVCLALVIDHYDRRANEHHYERFKKLARVSGWTFFVLALVWHVFGPRVLRG
ncbi:MAG: hypothetical protein KA795_05630 [Burkholderiaceae bacterium]|nr:hypothetical protein [Burkholderiaceae bacterium]